ncbi:MAG: type IV pili methyl-accepting chemotaxis transducer N-terminal domain-containing protein [Flavobacteriales bacterium]|nr:type IV pili methyl-accepting chemotaxis transducer N-terminal domain-containing protein [Flavobacteriales bacterium]
MKDQNILLKLELKYIFVLAATLLILVTNQVVIQYYLRAKKLDASTVNIAGKQRMLSQKLALLTYDAGTVEKKLAIREVYSEMVQANEGLRFGNDKIGIRRASSEEAQKLLYGLQGRLTTMIQQVESIIVKNDSPSQAFLNESASFLDEMNQVVMIIETESNNKLQRILTLEIILFALSIIVLFLEVQYFFKPLFRRTQIIADKNEDAVTTIRKMAFEFAHNMRAPLTNILAIVDLMQEEQKANQTSAPEANEGESDLMELLTKSAEVLDNSIKDSVKELNSLRFKQERLS